MSTSKKNKKPKVLIIAESKKDFVIIKKAINILEYFDIQTEIKYCSFYDISDNVKKIMKEAELLEFSVAIVSESTGLHLPALVSANTNMPVIGLPIKEDTIEGLNSLLATIKMPGECPVATVAIDGAENAGIMAAKMLSVGFPDICSKISEYKEDLKIKVNEKSKLLKLKINMQ